MQKAIAIAFFIQIVVATGLAARGNSHLEKLKSKYPFGLLTDDFGILSEADLDINTCGVDVEPVTSHSPAYPYWQCFEVKDARFECEGSGYDPLEKGHYVILAISIHSKNEINEYLSRREIPINSCIAFKQDWKKLIFHQKYVCLSGEVIKYKKSVNGELESSWTFDKFKTSKGCSSYFVGECTLSACK